MTFTKAQQLMIDDGLPPSLIISQEDRNKAWLANPPKAGQYGKFNTEPTSYGDAMTESEIWLLLELKDSKERGAASLSCGYQRIIPIAHLVKLGFARQHGFGEAQFFITEAGLKEADKHKRPETLKDAYVLSGTGPAKLVKATTVIIPRPPGSGKGKAVDIVAMMRRPGGVTREEVLTAVGWKAVSLQQQAAQCGVTIEIDKSRKPYRYMVK